MKVTNGLIAKEDVIRIMKKPKSRQVGHIRDEFLVEKEKIILGSISFDFTEIPLRIRSLPIIFFKSDDNTKIPQLNANFFDVNGRQTLKIIDNEWIADTNNWDIESKGAKIIIREQPGKICLKLDFSERSTIIIERLDMNIFGYYIEVRKNSVKINGSTFGECRIIGGSGGISLN